MGCAFTHTKGDLEFLRKDAIRNSRFIEVETVNNIPIGLGEGVPDDIRKDILAEKQFASIDRENVRKFYAYRGCTRILFYVGEDVVANIKYEDFKKIINERN